MQQGSGISATEEIYLAPAFMEDVAAYTEESLLALEEVNTRNPLYFFALGNFYIAEGNYEESVSVYQKAIELCNEQECAELPKIQVNRGIANFRLGKKEKAKKQFETVLSSSPKLVLANLFLGRILLENDKPRKAKDCFLKVRKESPDNPQALKYLGDLAKVEGDLQEAREFYRLALRQLPEDSELSEALGSMAFWEGEAIFVEGKRRLAYEQWGLGWDETGYGFLRDRSAALRMKSLVEDFFKASSEDKLLQKLIVALKKEDGTERVYHLFCDFFFSLGLFPEAYEKWGGLDEQKKRWKDNLVRDGEHPYAHFRLGLIAAYRSDLEVAREEFRLCYDQLLPKKQNQLKLNEIMDFLQSLDRQLAGFSG